MGIYNTCIIQTGWDIKLQIDIWDTCGLPANPIRVLWVPVIPITLE